jgi:hypothetical protein
MERMVSSEVPMHVQVSLIDRGIRFGPTSFRRLLDSSPREPRHYTRKGEPRPAGGGVIVEAAERRSRCVWMRG